MITVNGLSRVAALMGDPARAAMLTLLMDGRAHTASELALAAGIAAPTASGHLGRLVEAELLAARAQGRNRFYRLASPEVAHAIESLMAIAGTRAPPASQSAAWRRDPDLRFCRTCYDHLAGQVGIAVTDALTRAGHLEPEGARDWRLTESGEALCTRLGVDLAGARRAGSRHFARQCLDWSERRPHVAGALGAAIADTFFKRGWAERLRRSRTVRLTDSGRRALGSHFGAAV
ncbi:MAG: helix-turn-helix transcriptional regulator [Reyranellaceae bacterium]